MKKWSKIIFFLFSATIVYGQVDNNLNINYSPAFVFKHKKELRFEIPKYSYQIGIKYCIPQFSSERDSWQNFWGNPNFTLETAFTNFGDGVVLGHAFAINPGIQFYLKRFKWATLKLNIQTGIGYINKTFNRIYNENNNAISSHFNNNTKFELGINFPTILNGNLEFLVGFSHFSNGKTKLPNSGINYYYAGLQFKIATFKKNSATSDFESNKVSTPKKVLKRYGLGIYYGLGWSTSENIGGPQYLSSVIGTQVYYALSEYIHIFSGFEREFHGPSYYYFIRDFVADNEAEQKATKHIISVGSELFFGKISSKYQIGYYLPKDGNINNQPIFFRLQTNYYPIGRRKKVSPYLGVAMKSHYGVADFISYNVGIVY